MLSHQQSHKEPIASLHGKVFSSGTFHSFKNIERSQSEIIYKSYILISEKGTKEEQELRVTENSAID
jgi:hypothetical protein